MRSLIAALRRDGGVRGQLHDEPVGKPHVDCHDVARQQPCVAIRAGQLVDRLVLAVLGKLDRHAVLEPDVPAPFGDPDVALDARCQLGMALDPGDECRRRLRRAEADDQRQHGMAAAA